MKTKKYSTALIVFMTFCMLFSQSYYGYGLEVEYGANEVEVLIGHGYVVENMELVDGFGNRYPGYYKEYGIYLNSYGVYHPMLYRIGTSFTLVLSMFSDWPEDHRWTETWPVTVVKPDDPNDDFISIVSPWYIRPNTTKIKIQIRQSHPGDKIIVKIGKKTYTKKITSYAYDKVYVLKIKKGSRPGTKIKYWVVNKFNQPITEKYKDKVYRYKK